MRFAAVAVLLLTTATASADVPDGDFLEFRSVEGRFAWSMPGKPTERKVSHKGIDATVWQLTVRDTTVYKVSYNDFPKNAAATPDEILDRVRDGTVQLAAPFARLTAERRITIDGHPGRELDIVFDQPPTMRSSVRLYYVKGRLYTMTYTSDAEGTAMRDKFLASLRLLK